MATERIKHNWLWLTLLAVIVALGVRVVIVANQLETAPGVLSEFAQYSMFSWPVL